ncbi:MAG: SxtJ family membrane protein, partial [Alphaproteobacteria bacterium]
ISTKLVKPIYILMQLVMLPVGWVVSHIVMAVFFFVVLTPVGLVFRLFGRDLLCRRYDAAAKTYWRRRRKSDSMKRYFNQF